MVNQAREDADFRAAEYIENYLDCVENLPDDLQRRLTRMLELDATCQRYVREYEQQQKILARGNVGTATKRKALIRIQKALVIMQDIGDDKLQLMQSIHDLIEKKARQLDIDLKNLRPRLEQENNEPFNISDSNSSSSNSKSIFVNNEKQNRPRRTRADTSTELQAADTSVLSENQSSNLPSTSNTAQKRRNTTSTSKKKKRKSLNNQNVQNQNQEEKPAVEEDPDEPLYCICNQISFGKMIMCDNDSCALEWFHFACVSLTTKPKGKWYCPQCRGSKPNVMKSKSQFR